MGREGGGYGVEEVVLVERVKRKREARLSLSFVRTRRLQQFRLRTRRYPSNLDLHRLNLKPDVFSTHPVRSSSRGFDLDAHHDFPILVLVIERIVVS